MNNTILIFSDEAGQYYKFPTQKNIVSDPFYVRSGVFISTEDYMNFQNFSTDLKKEYNVPLNQEIKWSDIYELQKNRLRDDFLRPYSAEDIKQYIHIFLAKASELKSIKYIFTITKNRIDNIADKEYIIYAHLQNIYQRAQIDANSTNNSFYMVIIDDIDTLTLNYLKDKCSDLLHNGDKFLTYDNLNQSLLVENSKQSAGIQLADYSAGIFNSVAKKYLLSFKGYDYANELYFTLIAPHIRNLYNTVSQYGIIKITNKISCENLKDLIELTNKYINH